MRGSIERRTDYLGIRERDVEAVAELHQLALVQLLLLVCDVAPLARLTQPVALDRARQNHRRRALVRDRRRIRGVHLDRIVAAQPQPPELIVAQVFHQRPQARVDAPEVLPDVGAARHGVLLVLAINHLAHPPHQQALIVARQQAVPLATPQHLDHVPADAAEDGLKLLDDLTVAAHRTIKPLQVAIHNKDQIVERLARGQCDRPERLRLIGLAVAQEAPDLAVGRRNQAAILEVANEARLVDRLNRAEPHRDRGKLPEVVEQPGMRIGRQSADHLAPEAVQLARIQPPLDICARVDARRRVALEVDQVAALGMILPAKEVVEAHLIQRRRRGIGRNVPADPVAPHVGFDDHRHRVPTDDALDPPLQLDIARVGRLLLDRDRVDVGRLRGDRQPNPRSLRLNLQRLQQAADSLGPAAPRDIAQRVDPVVRFQPVIRPIEAAAGQG